MKVNLYQEAKPLKPLLVSLHLMETTNTPCSQMNRDLLRLLLAPKLLRDLKHLLGLKLLLDPLRLPFFPFSRILMLTATANKTWIESSRHFSMPQREDLETNLRPRPWTFIAVDHIWNVITFASNVKIILLLIEPLGQNKFRLRPLFYGIESTSAGSSISRS